MRTKGTLCVVGFATISLALAVPVAAQSDHLKCYKVRDPLLLSGTVDLTSPQFGADPGCKIARGIPALFCVPATKTVVDVRDRATGQSITPLPVTGPDPGDRLCYKIKCPAPSPPDQQVTDQFGTRTVSGLRAKLLCTPAVKGGPPTTTTTTSSTTTTTLRFVDNGDGTVTDHQTGLQWEKKDSAGGGANLSNPHDVDNTYTWSTSGTAADGTAYTDFLSQLNTCTSGDGVTVTASFAGHCDWRLPTIAEQQTILLAPAPCGTSPCIDPIFGPTAASLYWSSTTQTPGPPIDAWGVLFDSGFVSSADKPEGFYVRAVRGGS